MYQSQSTVLFEDAVIITVRGVGQVTLRMRFNELVINTVF